MTSEQRAELRRLAAAATPGEWFGVSDTAGVAGPDGDHVAECFGNLALGGDAADNAAYIAAANPQAVLALLDALDQRDRALEAALITIRAWAGNGPYGRRTGGTIAAIEHVLEGGADGPH